MSEAVGYSRISEKDQSNNSLNNQSVGITEYCRNNNLTLHKIFTDNGRSAFTFDRPEWLKLEAYIKANKSVKFLIVYHLDRFSRANLMDALVKLNEIETKLKVKVLTVNDSVSQDNNDLSVQMLRTINLLFANNERNRIQDRIKDGNYRSLSEGRVCNHAPVGYLNSRDHNNKPLLVIDRSKAPYIKEIFSLYNSGMNIEQIRRTVRLNLKGNSAVQRILSNPVYAAIIKLPPYKGKPAMEIDAIHEPIISKYDYFKAVARLNKKTSTVQPSDDVWLRGILHCTCGRKMTAGNSKSKSGRYYWYYKCNTHKEKNYPAIKLHRQFLDILDLVSFDEGEIEVVKGLLLNQLEAHNNNKGGNIMRLKMELSKVERKISDTQAKFLTSENIDTKVFDSVINDLKSQAADYEQRLIKARTSADAITRMINDLLPRLSRISQVFVDFPLYRRQEFISVMFPFPLSYDGVYRTPGINPFFEDKLLKIKEKGQPKIEPPLIITGQIPGSTQNGNYIEHLEMLLNAFVA